MRPEWHALVVLRTSAELALHRCASVSYQRTVRIFGVSERRQATPRAERKRGVEYGDVASGQRDVAGGRELLDVRERRRLRDREYRRPAREECERDLVRRRAVALRDFVERFRAREVAAAERAVRDDRDAVLLAPRNHAVLDGSI